MAFYDMAGGQRFSNAPAMVQAGIEDGRKLREIALFNQHGQGIMNGDAAAMAEFARFDPVSAERVAASHSTRARQTQQGTLDDGLKMAAVLGRTRDESEFNRAAAWLSDNGMPQARGLIGKYAEAKPMFDLINDPGNADEIVKLKQYVSQLDPELQQQAFQMGMLKLATGTAMQPGPNGQLMPVNAKTDPNLSITTGPDGKQVITFGAPPPATVGQAYNPAEVQGTVDLLGEIKNDPALKNVTGWLMGGGGNDVESLNAAQRAMLGTAGLAVIEKLNQLQSRSWLAAREMLKGGGPITDYESRKAEAAVARLSRVKSHEDMVAALQDLEDAVVSGMEKLSAKGRLNPDDEEWLKQTLGAGDSNG